MRVELNAQDARRVLELIEAFCATETVDDYADVTMHGLVKLIPSIDASYNEMIPAQQHVSFRAYPNPGEKLSEFQPVFARLMHQNPLVKHFHETGDTRSLMWSDFVSPQQLHATELYQSMFRELGIESQMAVTLPTSPDTVVGFAVNTGPDGFTERDRAVLNALRPHLGYAYRAIKVREELSATRNGNDRRTWTAALADENGIVESVTDDAAELAAATGIEIVAGEPLPSSLRDPFTETVAHYRPSDPAVRGRSVRLSDAADGTVAWATPGPVGPHTAVVRRGANTVRRRLTEVGLSPREIDVALELTEGGTNAAIARRLGIAEGTLRKHLERIYRTLEVGDRASAIAAILSG